MSPCAAISHWPSSRVLEVTEISLPGNFSFQPSIVGLESRVLEIAAIAIVGVFGFDQFVGRFRKPRRSEIDALQRIGFHGLELAGGGIEQRERREIQIAFVGLNISALRVFMELDHVATSQRRCRYKWA